MKIRSLFNYGIILAAALTMTCACSDDDDDKKKSAEYEREAVEYTPEWWVDMTASDQAPDWQAPDASLYENWAILMVTLEPYLASYATDNDLMAVYINDELRALSLPSRTKEQHIKDGDGNVQFILKIFGNELSGKEVKFTLKYYSAHLHQIFTLSGMEKFVAEEEYGIKELFVPPLKRGSSKYPVVTDLNVKINVAEDSDFKQDINDIVAVFIGGECRGTFTFYENTGDERRSITFPVFSREEGEKADIRYYSRNENAILTFKDAVTLKGGEQYTEINF